MTFRKEVILAAGLLFGPIAADALLASDHADTAQNVNRQGADLTDLFIFPNPNDTTRVVLAMDVHGLLPAGQGANFSFDPGVLYQFKIDNTGDSVEDLVIQARFSGTGPNQKVLISGPYKPLRTGSTTVFANPSSTIGTLNTTYSIGAMKVFAGVRSDPFFFDLNRFYAILPDRMTPLTGRQIDVANPNGPQVNGFRGFDASNPAYAGFDHTPAQDYLANLNVGSIVVEMPKAMLGGKTIQVWMTTSVAAAPPGFNFAQQDRLARPAINEALATVSQSRHLINDIDNPTDDNNALAADIHSFLTYPAGRDAYTQNFIVGVLVPDVMIANLAATENFAAYLGAETGGITGSKFGGRALTDDIVDLDLSVVFGKVVAALTGHDDLVNLVQFTTDNVGPHKDTTTTFPYLGAPH